MPQIGPKATNGYNSFWRDHYAIIQSLIASELGIFEPKVIRREVTARIKEFWNALSEAEKNPTLSVINTEIKVRVFSTRHFIVSFIALSQKHHEHV